MTDFIDFHDIFHEIQEKSKDGNYIYRGEPNCTESDKHGGKVSSRLWRECVKHNIRDVEGFQKTRIEYAKRHTTSDAQECAILTEIQHYGGDTNLIDFTTSCFVALFFACNGHFDKDGRVIVQDPRVIVQAPRGIVQDPNEHKKRIMRPSGPVNRVLAQKSIFIRHEKGYLEPKESELIRIPSKFKEKLLTHLDKYHGISVVTIYNDLYGYIQYQHYHGTALEHFSKGIGCEQSNELESAMGHYGRAIQLNRNFAGAYFRRGQLYHKKTTPEDCAKAIDDFRRAVEIEPDFYHDLPKDIQIRIDIPSPG